MDILTAEAALSDLRVCSHKKLAMINEQLH
jgi:hypothetical protein